MDGSHGQLSQAGVYRREVNASLARIWENVFDWEHLPSLHARDFAACTLIERGGWGWRIRLVNQPGDAAKAQVLELRADKAARRYVVTTLDGPGASSEIRVALTPRTARTTGVDVTFHVPEHRPDRLARIGASYVAAYERLWDEDEAMMRERERALARSRRARGVGQARQARGAGHGSVRLGPLEEVRARLPLATTFAGHRFRIVELDGALIAHAATCPHWLGPLDETPVIDGCVTCPWHGYRFDVRTGESADGRGLKLAIPPRIIVENGIVSLVSNG